MVVTACARALKRSGWWTCRARSRTSLCHLRQSTFSRPARVVGCWGSRRTGLRGDGQGSACCEWLTCGWKFQLQVGRLAAQWHFLWSCVRGSSLKSGTGGIFASASVRARWAIFDRASWKVDEGDGACIGKYRKWSGMADVACEEQHTLPMWDSARSTRIRCQASCGCRSASTIPEVDTHWVERRLALHRTTLDIGQ